MKRIKYLIVLVLSLLFIPNVFALTATTRITGNTSINVGDTTLLYVRMDSNNTIKGADITFGSSGAIEVVSAEAAGGMVEQSRIGNKVVLYSTNGVSSGTAVMLVKVRGTVPGTGTFSINNASATLLGNAGDEVALTNPAVFNMVVTNQPVNNITPEESQRIKEALINKATLLTEASQKSLNEDDYNAAIEAVNALEEGDLKTKLLKDLEDVKFKIAVNNATTNCNKENECNCPKPVTSKKWIILTVILLLISLIEFAYIVINKYIKKEDEEKIEPIVIKPIEAAKITKKEEEKEEASTKNKTTKKENKE